jgi:cation diffusion facilitator CzcD-associated flavoprotein CzcO
MAINEVAVIGAGGVAGLATIYELLHTNADGSSSVGKGKSTEPFFTKIVGFEQKSSIGGTWNVEDYQPDPELPSEEVLQTGEYDNVRVIKPPHKLLPSSVDLSKTSVSDQIETSKDESYLQWAKSGIYPRLYTNVPESYMRYSTTDKNDECPTGLDPFITHQQLHKRMADFSQDHSLKEHIRFNTEVYNVKKEGEKWILTLRRHTDTHDYWYQEKFDGVILAQGSFAIPYIPRFKGLSEFNKLHPGVVLHSKAYRDPEQFKGKKVVIVGGNISAIDIGQYLAPLAKEVIVSRDLSREPYLPYMARCINSFLNKPLIKEFLPYSNKIRLIDGTLLSNVDHVILCTGYHIELPFLEPGILNYTVPENANAPNSNSRIKGLYQHIFNIEDPSLAFVGKLIVQTLFRNMESQAAAIVGIWSGAKTLPSKEDQYEWEQERLAETEEHLFHKYDIYKVKDVYFDKVRPFHTINRPDPLNDNLLDELKTYENSLVKFEELFNDFREGRIDALHKF